MSQEQQQQQSTTKKESNHDHTQYTKKATHKIYISATKQVEGYLFQFNKKH